MEKNFNVFMSQLQKTNRTLDFFCDFEKIISNVEDVKLSLYMLNSLIGAKDMRKAVETIWKRDKTAFNAMSILIAVRDDNKEMILDSENHCVKLKSLFTSVDGVIEYLETTGLKHVLQQRRINDLVDYVFGIETGLDTNARKNRSGHIMENKVAMLLNHYNIKYRREVYSREWPEISLALGTDEKRFDFVIHTRDIEYLIEVNFYSGGGSKLNETARSYSEIAPKINGVKGFKFVWITDGVGWQQAKNKLHEAYNIIPHMYNLTSVEEFICMLKNQ